MMARFALGTLSIVLLLNGCGSDSADAKPHHQLSDAEKKAFRESWGSSAEIAPIAHPKSVQLASGPAPLAYICEQPGDIWISDDQGRQWGPAAGGVRTIVRISADTGIAIGDTQLERGPMAPERVYVIHQGTPAEQTWKSGPVREPARK